MLLLLHFQRIFLFCLSKVFTKGQLQLPFKKFFDCRLGFEPFEAHSGTDCITCGDVTGETHLNLEPKVY